MALRVLLMIVAASHVTAIPILQGNMYTNPVINSNHPDPGVLIHEGTIFAATTSGDAPDAFPIMVCSSCFIYLKFFTFCSMNLLIRLANVSIHNSHMNIRYWNGECTFCLRQQNTYYNSSNQTTTASSSSSPPTFPLFFTLSRLIMRHLRSRKIWSTGSLQLMYFLPTHQQGQFGL